MEKLDLNIDGLVQVFLSWNELIAVNLTLS